MIFEISPDPKISFESFWAMRFLKSWSDLNIIAEFLKFCTHKYEWNHISHECVRSVLECEEMISDIVDMKV